MRTSTILPGLRAGPVPAGTTAAVCQTRGPRRGATRAAASAGAGPSPTRGAPAAARRSGAWARRVTPRAVKGPVSDVEAVQRSLTTHKPVQPVSSEEREQVHLVAYLSSLAANAEAVTAAQLVEHRLELITTSARCGFAGAFDRAFDRGSNAAADAADPAAADWYEDGDGMAAPASVVRANAERAASAIGGAAAAGAGDGQMGAAWGAPGGGGERRRRGAHTLDALTAENDHRRLQGAAAAAAGSALAALQRRVRRAGQGAAAPQVNQSGGYSFSSVKHHPNALWEGMETDDEGAQEGPSLELLRAAAAAAAKEGRGPAGDASPGGAAAAKKGAGARAQQQPQQQRQALRDPASRWLAADCPDTSTRFFVIAAPPALEAAFGATAAAQRAAANADPVAFESPSLHARVDRAVYAEACALYNALIPLIMDHLESRPAGRVALAGAGLGGSLAAVVTLMLAARGLRHGALAPAVALNAPPVVLETPDYAAFCSPRGCSLEEVAAMVNDSVSRGILSALGLPQGAVLNVFYAPTATGGAGAGGLGGSFGSGRGGAGGRQQRRAGAGGPAGADPEPRGPHPVVRAPFPSRRHPHRLMSAPRRSKGLPPVLSHAHSCHARTPHHGNKKTMAAAARLESTAAGRAFQDAAPQMNPWYYPPSPLRPPFRPSTQKKEQTIPQSACPAIEQTEGTTESVFGVAMGPPATQKDRSPAAAAHKKLGP